LFPLPFAPLLLPLLLFPVTPAAIPVTPEIVPAVTPVATLTAVALLALPLLPPYELPLLLPFELPLLPPLELPLLLPLELPLVPLAALDVVVPASCEAQTVSLSATFRAVPGAELPPWARPWVTLWKFSLTSPSEADIRVTPCLAPPASPCPSARLNCPLAAWRGAESPDFGTMICWMVDARGRPCSMGLNVPVPLNERPGLPCAKAVASPGSVGDRC
jgi:hypothetical protein